MARDLIEQDDYSRQLLAEVETRLSLPLRRLMLEGPDSELQATQNAQPAILFHSLGLLHHLTAAGRNAAAVAGHSLGEFAGLVAAGGLQPIDALAAVRARGEAMAAAAPAGSGMVAVLGLDDAVVERICSEIDGVVPANYNSPGQLVVSGADAALGAASEALQQAGARRVVRLPVSAAFHSPLMQPAARRFAQTWEGIPLRPLVRKQVFNADAAVHLEPGEVRPLMVGQLTGPVRWTQSVLELKRLGVDTFVEVGPGRTLTGLVKKIIPGAVVHNIDGMKSLETYLGGAHA
jgi:[acyl-carrier-protein] S-malonyltransferase